jgi:putative ABC transport system permease protein
LLYGLKPLDPATFLATPLLLSLVALAACLLPAVRAARVDPGVLLFITSSGRIRIAR